MTNNKMNSKNRLLRKDLTNNKNEFKKSRIVNRIKNAVVFGRKMGGKQETGGRSVVFLTDKRIINNNDTSNKQLVIID